MATLSSPQPTTAVTRTERFVRSSTVLPVAVALVVVTSLIVGGAAVISRCIQIVSGLRSAADAPVPSSPDSRPQK